MATILYSDFAAVQLAPTPTTMLDTIQATPTFRILQPKYTFVGTEAATNIIRVCKLPAGTIVIPYLSNVVSDGVATTATITVGDYAFSSKDTVVADADRYSTSLDVAAAGADAFTGGVAATVPYELPAERWLTATIASMDTPVAGKILQFNLALNVVS